MTDERLERWLDELVSTPGLTSLEGEQARRVHLDESLAAAELELSADQRQRLDAAGHND